MVIKRKAKGHFYWLILEVISDFVLASQEKRGWRLVGLGGGGVAVGVNTWLCIVVNGLSKVEGSHMPEVSVICLDLEGSSLQVTKLLKTARLGVW